MTTRRYECGCCIALDDTGQPLGITVCKDHSDVNGFGVVPAAAAAELEAHLKRFAIGVMPEPPAPVVVDAEDGL